MVSFSDTGFSCTLSNVDNILLQNGGVMGGVPMGYLDFTPEPPAPSATPVTEHVDLNLGHSHDTRDLSSK